MLAVAVAEVVVATADVGQTVVARAPSCEGCASQHVHSGLRFRAARSDSWVQRLAHQWVQAATLAASAL